MLSIADVAVVVLAFVAMFLAARRGKGSDAQGFIVAGRSLTIPFFVASLVATWYGAILGSGEFILRYGVVFLLCFGLPYYVVALLYAGFLAKRIHNSQAVSIPDQFGRVYGPRGRTISALVLLVITTPASYQLMMGIILAYSLQIPLLAGIAAGTVVSIAFVAGGGLRSDIYANTVQFVLMYAGMMALVFFAVRAYGSPAAMWAALPEPTTTLPGSIGWTGIAGWFLIALQTFIDPNFYVRTVAATNERVARRGLAISVAFWMLFDALQLLAGLYVVAYAPATDPTLSYLSFGASVLPPVALGLFVASLLAVVMSALDGYALSSATMLAHDIGPAVGRKHSPIMRYRIALVLVASAGMIVAFLVPSIIDIIFYGGSIAVSAILLPLILSFTTYAPRLRTTIVVQLTIPALTAVISRISNVGEPIFAGLIASAVVTSLAIVFTPHAKAARNTLHGL